MALRRQTPGIRLPTEISPPCFDSNDVQDIAVVLVLVPVGSNSCLVLDILSKSTKLDSLSTSKYNLPKNKTTIPRAIVCNDRLRVFDRRTVREEGCCNNNTEETACCCLLLSPWRGLVRDDDSLGTALSRNIESFHDRPPVNDGQIVL
jgi:hypothetical protein